MDAARYQQTSEARAALVRIVGEVVVRIAWIEQILGEYAGLFRSRASGVPRAGRILSEVTLLSHLFVGKVQ